MVYAEIFVHLLLLVWYVFKCIILYYISFYFDGDVCMIVQNKISGVVHTQDCESVKQMKPENIRKLEEHVPLDNWEICEHCVDKDARKRFLKLQCEARLTRLREERENEIKKAIQEINMKYEKEEKRILSLKRYECVSDEFIVFE